MIRRAARLSRASAVLSRNIISGVRRICRHTIRPTLSFSRRLPTARSSENRRRIVELVPRAARRAARNTFFRHPPRQRQLGIDGRTFGNAPADRILEARPAEIVFAHSRLSTEILRRTLKMRSNSHRAAASYSDRGVTCREVAARSSAAAHRLSALRVSPRLNLASISARWMCL